MVYGPDCRAIGLPRSSLQRKNRDRSAGSARRDAREKNNQHGSNPIELGASCAPTDRAGGSYKCEPPLRPRARDLTGDSARGGGGRDRAYNRSQQGRFQLTRTTPGKGRKERQVAER